MLLNYGVGEDTLESLGLEGDPTSPSWRSVQGVHWKEWSWSWNSNTLVTSCEELTHWKRPWCWEGLGAGGEGDDRGWDGWMASPTCWTWVWVKSGSLWWTWRPGMLQFMGSQRVRHDWATELNWTEFIFWGLVLLIKKKRQELKWKEKETTHLYLSYENLQNLQCNINKLNITLYGKELHIWTLLEGWNGLKSNKSINITYYIKPLRKKNYIIISIKHWNMLLSTVKNSNGCLLKLYII